MTSFPTLSPTHRERGKAGETLGLSFGAPVDATYWLAANDNPFFGCKICVDQ